MYRVLRVSKSNKVGFLYSKLLRNRLCAMVYMDVMPNIIDAFDMEKELLIHNINLI